MLRTDGLSDTRRTSPAVAGVSVLAMIPVILGSACGSGTSAGPGGDNGPGGGLSGSAAIGVVGGSEEDQVRDVAFDGQGNLFIAGVTRSDDFPVTAGAYQTEFNPGTRTSGGTRADAFLMKMSPTGEVQWSTLIGGPHHDRAYGIEVGDDGFIYVAGRAGPGFPTTAGVFQPEFGGGDDNPPYGRQDGFVCKVAPDGGSVAFCSYFGGSDNTIVRDVAVDSRGDIYVASAHAGGIYPTGVASAFLNGPRGDIDAVVAKISADGTRVLWSRHLGGSAREGNTNSVRLDAAGNAYFINGSRSCDIPEIGPGAAQPTCGGNASADVIVTRIDPSSGAVVWSTYLGGSGNDGLETHELGVTPDGAVVVAIGTPSLDFPIAGNPVQATHGGGTLDIAVARISSDGSTLEASTFLGGSDDEDAQGIAVGADGTVFLTGSTRSSDFPTTAGAIQPAYGGGRDMVVVGLSPGLDRLIYSSFLGGSDEQRGRAAAVRGGRFLFGGATESADWPAMGSAPFNPGGSVDAAFGAVTTSDN